MKSNIAIIVEFSKSNELLIFFQVENVRLLPLIANIYLVNVCEAYLFHTQVVSKEWVICVLNLALVCSPGNNFKALDFIADIAGRDSCL
tara:strand:+ start:54 stop:320 length:267 start_codon:yes stop_codon:yes gene_type:complete